MNSYLGQRNECVVMPEALNNIPIKKRSKKRLSFFECFQRLMRFWGVFTAVVLCGVGVDLAFHKRNLGYYYIAGSVAIFLLELTWIVTLFLQLRVRAENRISRCWSLTTWLEGWKKTILYAPLGAVPLIWPHNLWLSYVVAGQLFILAIFHLTTSFRGQRKKRRRDRVSQGDRDSMDSSKFEEVTEVLDDCVPETMPGTSHSLADSLVDQHQDTILEI